VCRIQLSIFGHTNVGNHSAQRPDCKITSIHGLTRNYLSNNIHYSTNAFIDGGKNRDRHTSFNIMCGLDSSSSHPMKISVHKIKLNCVIKFVNCSCDVLLEMREFYVLSSFVVMTQTDRFLVRTRRKIFEIVCNLQQISSGFSLIPWILRMFASCVKWNLMFATFHLFVKRKSQNYWKIWIISSDLKSSLRWQVS